MPFLLLLLLMLACLPVEWPQPPGWIGLLGSVALTWWAVGLAVAAAAVLALRTRRSLRRHPERRDTILRRYSAGRFYHLLGLFAIYGLSLYVLGWGWAVQTFCTLGPADQGPIAMAPGTELLILTPFLAALVLSWVCFYDAERALHDTGPASLDGSPFWSRSAYVGFHVRHNLALVFAPIALLIAAEGLLRLWPDLQDDNRFQVAAMGLVAGVFIGMPWVLRLVLGLRPLPNGPLRQRLLATARRLHFRFSDILLWNTRGGVVNAMVAGILPYPRYVLLTDRLIADLTPDEVEAVFGHEIGHVKHRHMLYYLGFIVMSLAVVSELWRVMDLESWLGLTTRQDLAVLPRLAFLGTYIFVVFGFLSRRCEGQADIYGCRAVSCGRSDCWGHTEDVALAPAGRGLCPTGICTFIDALEKVARLNGMSRDKPGWLQSWQHSTIARRVEFLQRILHDPTHERRFQRTVGLVKWGVLLALAGILVALGKTQGWSNLLAL